MTVARQRPASNREQRRRDDGFSLLDMLVALVLMGLIGVLLSGLAGQFGSIRQARANAAVEAELDAALTYVANVVEQAMPLPLLAADGLRGPHFRGDVRQLEFVAVQRRGTTAHGLRETAFLVDEEGGERVFVQDSWPRRAVPDMRQSGALRVPIVAGVDAVRFAYLMSDTGDLAWLDEWASTEHLPLAVRVTLGSSRSGQPLQSTATIMLRMAEPAPPAIDAGQ
jgi:type II secretory pathway component PulJ